jgi:hypothetical protein
MNNINSNPPMMIANSLLIGKRGEGM